MTDENDQSKERARQLALDIRWLGYDGVRVILERGGQASKVRAAFMDRVSRAATRIRRAQNDLADERKERGFHPLAERRFTLRSSAAFDAACAELRRREAVHAAFKRANVVFDATAGRYDLDVTIDGDTVRMFEAPADLEGGYRG